MPEEIEAQSKSTRRRRWLFVTAALLLCYFLLPFTLNFLAACLVREDPLQPADVIIVMGGGRHCLRLQYGVELYRQSYGKKLIFSGIESFEGSDAEEKVRQQSINFGASAADIFILTNTFNTRTEAGLLTALMQKHGWKSALVVTEPSHTRRARYTLQKAAPDLRFTAHPVPPDRPDVWRPERWWTRHSDTRHTIREFLAWINTLLGGLR